MAHAPVVLVTERDDGWQALGVATTCLCPGALLLCFSDHGFVQGPDVRF